MLSPDSFTIQTFGDEPAMWLVSRDDGSDNSLIWIQDDRVLTVGGRFEPDVLLQVMLSMAPVSAEEFADLLGAEILP
ncbi:MAG: hypothetical protein ACI8Y4_000703 [Candidatus Poriferisodalaceae bacterium]